MEHQNVILYTDEQGHVSLEVTLEHETLWLNQAQIAELFGTKQPAISKHLSNIFKSGELDKNSVHSILEYTASDGKTYETSFYNLDAVLSVGYRVNSKNATQFRIWASKVLKDYLIKGYALNHQRINAQSLSELTATMELVRKSIETKELSSNEAKGLFDIINNYAKTWALLQGYDADALHALQGTLHQRFILDYDEAKSAIKALKKDLMAKGDATELFGNEKAGEFQSALLNIYQTFGGVDLLPSIEEKAANLLYYVIKDHAFSDGNKRIG
ncbi:MAG: Fic/DOC family protein, partial [Epsilonproteobacteria bacterium]|nr:Fic/DOC family protein [Campylobacterota bacterium]